MDATHLISERTRRGFSALDALTAFSPGIRAALTPSTASSSVKRRPAKESRE